MHTLAVVSTIKKITPIEGKDRIVLANIENYNSVVSKDEFHEGDLAVYVFYDSILPEREEFEFLRKRCWSPKYNGFRIRPMKLGNVISEGLVLPMSFLPSGNYKVGDVVTDVLGIIPYDPEYNPTKPKKEPKGFMAFMMKQSWFRKIVGMYYDYKKVHNNMSYPNWVVKSDEENIEKCYDIVKNYTDDFIVSEKVEGMATSYIFSNNKFKVYSHNWRVKNGSWVDYANATNLENKMREYCKKHKIKTICIQGELVGPQIQSNIYNFSEYKLFMYGGFHSNKKRFTWTELNDIAKELDIPVVPYIKTVKMSDFNDIDEMLKDSDGQSVLNNVPREGFVYRNEDCSVHFKVKGRAYKIWWENKCVKD